MDVTQYKDKLTEVLTARIEKFNSDEIKQLKDNCKLFQSSFLAIYNVLTKKGIIHDDPYKYEFKISELGIPSEKSFADSDKIEQMGIRISQFESYLDFLTTYYQFSIEFLSMGRIKRLVMFIKYFDFTHFTVSHENINTRALAEIIEQAKKSVGDLSSGIIAEGLSKLDKTSRVIFKLLKDLMLLQKERYKLYIRTIIAGIPKLNANLVNKNKDTAISLIKKKLSEADKHRPFYLELVTEVLAEDYGPSSDELRNSILTSLQISNNIVQPIKTVQNLKLILLEGLRILITVGFQLDDAMKKLEENQAIVDSLDRSFLRKIKYFVRTMFGKKDKHVTYEIELFDPVSNVHKIELLDFTNFCYLVSKRTSVLVAMLSKSGAAFKKVESADENVVYDFLTKNISEMQSFHRRMTGLDKMFDEMIKTSEFKSKVKSIKTELSSIKNAILAANKKRHEYIAQKEENAQMQRLGIK